MGVGDWWWGGQGCGTGAKQPCLGPWAGRPALTFPLKVLKRPLLLPSCALLAQQMGMLSTNFMPQRPTRGLPEQPLGTRAQRHTFAVWEEGRLSRWALLREERPLGALQPLSWHMPLPAGRHVPEQQLRGAAVIYNSYMASSRKGQWLPARGLVTASFSLMKLRGQEAVPGLWMTKLRPSVLRFPVCSVFRPCILAAVW